MATLKTPVNAAGVEREDDRDDAHGPFVVVETKHHRHGRGIFMNKPCTKDFTNCDGEQLFGSRPRLPSELWTGTLKNGKPYTRLP